MPSPVLATRLIRPFTLMFFRSLDIKNIQPKVLYLLRTSAGQCHTICTLSSFSSLHNWQSCHCASPILNIWALGVVWPVNSPTATLSFCLLMDWSFFLILERGCRSSWRSFTTTHHKSGDKTTPCAQPLSGLFSMVVSPWLMVKFLSANISSTQSISASRTLYLILAWFTASMEVLSKVPLDI